MHTARRGQLGHPHRCWLVGRESIIVEGSEGTIDERRRERHDERRNATGTVIYVRAERRVT